ncbi:hypothetical protein ACJX0J_038238, partial [Zea mays]
LYTANQVANNNNNTRPLVLVTGLVYFIKSGPGVSLEGDGLPVVNYSFLVKINSSSTDPVHVFIFVFRNKYAIKSEDLKACFGRLGGFTGKEKIHNIYNTRIIRVRSEQEFYRNLMAIHWNLRCDHVSTHEEGESVAASVDAPHGDSDQDEIKEQAHADSVLGIDIKEDQPHRSLGDVSQGPAIHPELALMGSCVLVIRAILAQDNDQR